MADDRLRPQLKLEMLSQPLLFSGARALVGNLASRLGFNESEASQIMLAVDEALCNVINHGYKKRPDGVIWLNVWAVEGDEASIRIVIEDLAEQVDPSTIRSRNLDEIRPGGLGVHIIREVMDEVRYEKRDGRGMRLTMHKKVPQDRKPASSRTTVREHTSS